MANNFAIDYTSRDFDSIKSDLVKIIQTRLASQNKTWEATDASDFGVAMVEAFAYVGDIANYYIDRVANETYLPTAVQRSSVLKLARALNYVPGGFTQATVYLTVTNTDDQDLIIPEGAEFRVTVPVSSHASKKLLFTVNDEETIPAQVGGVPGVATITLSHGENVSLRTKNLADPLQDGDIDGEYLTKNSSGYASQTYKLAADHPVDSTIAVYVSDNGKYTPWTRVTHLYDYGPDKLVYSVHVNDDDTVNITFGDGVAGAIPMIGQSIKVQYEALDEGGAIGNVPADLKTWTLIAIPSGSNFDLETLTAGLTFTNPEAGFGGGEPESNDSIRANAPKVLSTMGRAVTLSDFANLALNVPGVGQNKSVAYANGPTSVILYVGPQNTVGTQSFYPGETKSSEGVFSITDGLLQLTSDVDDYLSDKTQIGVSTTTLPPVYADLNIVIRFKKASELSYTVTKTSILKALFETYGYDSVHFNQIIFPEDVEAALLSHSNAILVKVSAMYRDGGVESRDVFTPLQGELPVFSDNSRGGGLLGVEIYPVGAIASLALSSGEKLSKGFDPNHTSYTIVSTSGGKVVGSVTATPTLENPDDTYTLVVGGKNIAGATVSGSVKKFDIVVTSAGATNTYHFTIKR